MNPDVGGKPQTSKKKHGCNAEPTEEPWSTKPEFPLSGPISPGTCLQSITQCYPALLPNSLGTKSRTVVLTYCSYWSNKPAQSYCCWVAPASRSAPADGCFWVMLRGAVWGQPQLRGFYRTDKEHVTGRGFTTRLNSPLCHKTTDVPLVEGEGFITVHNTSWPPVLLRWQRIPLTYCSSYYKSFSKEG